MEVIVMVPINSQSIGSHSWLVSHEGTQHKFNPVV